MEKYSNALIHESSPYLLQHAHNPVNWEAWSDKVFERAQRENKLVLISVGYSACHWCHVMEHECFEDEEVAALMNKFFINVKVDREERPDVDQVYMTAVQLMTRSGGWPLNCFTLPDGRPIYGGTYFPKEQWMHVLKSLQHSFTNEKEKTIEYAEKLHEGIINSELIKEREREVEFDASKLKELIKRWSASFDKINGGEARAPKFPMPVNYLFLLDYGLKSGDKPVLDHVKLSLDKMAMGGIYDQAGGGFSRYSVDMLWKVPHFEKMLYDNGQLLEVYSKAYKAFDDPMYKRLIYDTAAWMERDMQDFSGAFYSAIDADSEGVEGKYYIWTQEELNEVFSGKHQWGQFLFEINRNGLWEDGNYILLRKHTDEDVMSHFNWSRAEFESQFRSLNRHILNHRQERIAPGTDDKALTSWNAITITGLCRAFIALNDKYFLDLAQSTAKWLVENQLKADGSLYRNFKNGSSTIDGFLEDYAHTIRAFITLYESDFNEEWLIMARELTKYTLDHFYDDASGMFFFTPEKSDLIARKMEVNDNVIPSSNSVMAINLYNLGLIFGDISLLEKARQMLANVYNGMEMYGYGYANWAILLNKFVYKPKEVVFSGRDAKEAISQFRKETTGEHLTALCAGNSKIPLCEGRHTNDSLKIYVCETGKCSLPVDNVQQAVSLVIQN